MVISSAASCIFFTSRQAITTLQLRLSNTRAVSRPIPAEAPVTMAHLPMFEYESHSFSVSKNFVLYTLYSDYARRQVQGTLRAQSGCRDRTTPTWFLLHNVPVKSTPIDASSAVLLEFNCCVLLELPMCIWQS